MVYPSLESLIIASPGVSSLCHDGTYGRYVSATFDHFYGVFFLSLSLSPSLSFSDESDPNVDELEGTNLGVSCGGYVADSSITLNPPQTLRDPTTSAIAGRLCIEDDFFMPPEEEEFPYIQIDQGVGVPVRAIIIRGYFDIQCWPASVEVYYSSDAENWECVSDAEDGTCKVGFKQFYKTAGGNSTGGGGT